MKVSTTFSLLPEFIQYIQYNATASTTHNQAEMLIGDLQ